MMAQRAAQRRHDRLIDRWIDLIAASYGMPRITLLRELQTMPHLARAIGAIVADNQRADAIAAAEEKAKKEQSEREMYDYLTELKRQQDEDRAQ
jgi:hypothetical protein